MFGVNCEINNIVDLLNFFRSFYSLWNLQSHSVCSFDQNVDERNCFYCSMRSSCVRLNHRRSKGLKDLIPVEFITQLPHYDDLEWNWKTNGEDLAVFIANTLRLLRRHDNNISELVGFPEGRCQNCLTTLQFKQKYIYQFQTQEIDARNLTFLDILQHLMTAVVSA